MMQILTHRRRQASFRRFTLPVPVQVSGLSSGVTAITAGESISAQSPMAVFGVGESMTAASWETVVAQAKLAARFPWQIFLYGAGRIRADGSHSLFGNAFRRSRSGNWIEIGSDRYFRCLRECFGSCLRDPKWERSLLGGRRVGRALASTVLRTPASPFPYRGFRPESSAFRLEGRNPALLIQDGSVWCWGSNFYGAMGGGALMGPTPHQVPGMTTGVTWASVGGTDCYIQNGGVQCAGFNTPTNNGILGSTSGSGTNTVVTRFHRD